MPMKNKSTGNTAAKKEGTILKSGQLLEVTITGLNDDGFGQARHSDTSILIAGALPRELILAKVTYVGRRETFAKIVKILRSSPDRIANPRCEKDLQCDGCSLLRMKYQAQLAWKKQLVDKFIRRYPSLGKTVLHDVIASPQQIHYRNSAKLVVAGKYADPIIGIYQRNTHEALEVTDCATHHPLINQIVTAVKSGIKKGKVAIYNPKSQMGLLRYVVIRVSEATNRAMVVFVTAERSYNEIHHLAKHLKLAVPEVDVIGQNINSSSGNVIFGQKDHFITKQQALPATIGDIRFLISPRSFFQVNSGSAGIIYEKVREWGVLTGTENVLDLYCGIGGISLFVARKCKEVVGIEVVDAAVADAQKNAQLNGFGNCSFVAGDVVRLLEDIQQVGKHFDLVVLNPPRKGCDETVLKKVASLGPKRIIYVSCSPETLARDLNILAGTGFATTEIQPVDMFPQTPHVENIALLMSKENNVL